MFRKVSVSKLFATAALVVSQQASAGLLDEGLAHLSNEVNKTVVKPAVEGVNHLGGEFDKHVTQPAVEGVKHVGGEFDKHVTQPAAEGVKHLGGEIGKHPVETAFIVASIAAGGLVAYEGANIFLTVQGVPIALGTTTAAVGSTTAGLVGGAGGGAVGSWIYKATMTPLNTYDPPQTGELLPRQDLRIEGTDDNRTQSGIHFGNLSPAQPSQPQKTLSQQNPGANQSTPLPVLPKNPTDFQKIQYAWAVESWLEKNHKLEAFDAKQNMGITEEEQLLIEARSTVESIPEREQQESPTVWSWTKERAVDEVQDTFAEVSAAALRDNGVRPPLVFIAEVATSAARFVSIASSELRISTSWLSFENILKTPYLIGADIALSSNVVGDDTLVSKREVVTRIQEKLDGYNAARNKVLGFDQIRPQIGLYQNQYPYFVPR